jgi:hypothetical protein
MFLITKTEINNRPTPLMVDKASQTDEWLYRYHLCRIDRDWLIKMRKLKKPDL